MNDSDTEVWTFQSREGVQHLCCWLKVVPPSPALLAHYAASLSAATAWRFQMVLWLEPSFTEIKSGDLVVGVPCDSL